MLLENLNKSLLHMWKHPNYLSVRCLNCLCFINFLPTLIIAPYKLFLQVHRMLRSTVGSDGTLRSNYKQSNEKCPEKRYLLLWMMFLTLRTSQKCSLKFSVHIYEMERKSTNQNAKIEPFLCFYQLIMSDVSGRVWFSVCEILLSPK